MENDYDLLFAAMDASGCREIARGNHGAFCFTKHENAHRMSSQMIIYRVYEAIHSIRWRWLACYDN